MTKAALQDLNILIVGVGGQGTILASRILAQVAQDAGYDVKVSEIHGMSQRGGSVTTQVRCSQRVAAPIITPGTVDVALAFERLEALRALPWLKEGGTIIINQQELMPMPVITGAAAYPADITEKIQAAAGEAIFLDAVGLAQKAGNVKAVNLVLLGKLASKLPIADAVWQKAIADIVPAKVLEINQKAFTFGKEA